MLPPKQGLYYQSKISNRINPDLEIAPSLWLTLQIAIAPALL